MRKFNLLLALILSSLSFTTNAQTTSKEEKKAEKAFIKHVDDALLIMEKAAKDMNVKGVAIVSFIPGKKAQSWASKMLVVGNMTNDKANFLGIASAKSAEMAETLINSGSKIRPPKNGELGYKGGVIKKTDSGYLLAAFSGATGEQDAAISAKALDWLETKF
jgi:hypothetical protein